MQKMAPHYWIGLHDQRVEGFFQWLDVNVKVGWGLKSLMLHNKRIKLLLHPYVCPLDGKGSID